MDYDEMLKRVNDARKPNTGSRFEPPEVETYQNGQKTIVELDKFAAYVNRPVGHISKYLMHELTANGQIDGGKLILGGRFSKKSVQEKISQYTKEYIICRECGSPDTHLIKEDRNYKIKCMGCGAEYPVGRIK
ncbi:MAG: translation initiation factor IF-2 subunit beta [Candidatus Acidifodinimicrobium sp.]